MEERGAYRLSRHSIRTSLNLALRMCSNENTYREENESRASRSLAMVPAFCSRPLLVVLVRETVRSEDEERGGGKGRQRRYSEGSRLPNHDIIQTVSGLCSRRL